ncbi:helix-turn-helix domain-containing protein [Dysgonomonas termitidis]|uniref:Helix-turn-helix domain-containing protein n=1 Tax=Dysgonomonas termitidis TaxID=1516126 RepID=A0ABV9KSK1_9BACT
MRLRLKESVILLEQSDLTIEEIAEKVGFGTVRTFQRQFMAMYNTSPTDYRKIKQGQTDINFNI